MSPLSLPVLVLLATSWGAHGLSRLQERYKWGAVDFTYPNADARAAAIASGAFVPTLTVPVDVDAYVNDGNQRVFLSMPNLLGGVPVTVATVANAPGGAPLLSPYPDWSWHRQGDQGDCEGLVSVFRLQVDQVCGRLWVLDTGRQEVLTANNRVCPPKLVVFDLRNGDTVVRKHVFSEAVLHNQSMPVTVAVDVRGSSADACASAFAYVADVAGYGIAVYDFKADKSWRVSHRHFYPYPTSGHFTIAGTSFDLMDGLMGLALTPVSANGDRNLYFHALASVREAWVSTSVLRNETLFANGGRDRFVLLDGERASQSATEAIDDSGVLFFSMASQNSLNCWVPSSGTPYGTKNFVTLDQDNDAIQFAAGLKVVKGLDGKQEVWLITNRFQKLTTPEGLNTQEVNFRVLRAPVSQLVRGTRCDKRFRGVLPGDKAELVEGLIGDALSLLF